MIINQRGILRHQQVAIRHSPVPHNPFSFVPPVSNATRSPTGIMKGARRTRKPRQEAGFADLMNAPHSSPLPGVVTGVSRAAAPSGTPPPGTPPPHTPPASGEDDWGALLQATPKRRISPHTARSSASSVASRSSAFSASRSSPPARNLPSTPSPPSHTRSPSRTAASPHYLFASPPKSPASRHNTPHTLSTPPPQTTPPRETSPLRNITASAHTPQSEASPALPAFLSGWDGADGWGDDPTLEESDPELDEDAWGVWPEGKNLSEPVPLTSAEPETARVQPNSPSVDQNPVTAHPSSDPSHNTPQKRQEHLTVANKAALDSMLAGEPQLPDEKPNLHSAQAIADDSNVGDINLQGDISERDSEIKTSDADDHSSAVRHPSPGSHAQLETANVIVQPSPSVPHSVQTTSQDTKPDITVDEHQFTGWDVEETHHEQSLDWSVREATEEKPTAEQLADETAISSDLQERRTTAPSGEDDRRIVERDVPRVGTSVECEDAPVSPSESSTRDVSADTHIEREPQQGLPCLEQVGPAAESEEVLVPTGTGAIETEPSDAGDAVTVLSKTEMTSAEVQDTETVDEVPIAEERTDVKLPDADGGNTDDSELITSTAAPGNEEPAFAGLADAPEAPAVVGAHQASTDLITAAAMLPSNEDAEDGQTSAIPEEKAPDQSLTTALTGEEGILSTPHDVSPRQDAVAFDGWGFGEDPAEVEDAEGEWGWGEGDDVQASDSFDADITATASLPQVDEKSSTVAPEVVPESSSDVATSPKGQSGRLVELLEDNAHPLVDSSATQSAPAVSSFWEQEVKPVDTAEPSADAWGFDEDLQEEEASDWDWGVEAKNSDVTQTVASGDISESKDRSANVETSITAADSLENVQPDFAAEEHFEECDKRTESDLQSMKVHLSDEDQQSRDAFEDDSIDEAPMPFGLEIAAENVEDKKLREHASTAKNDYSVLDGGRGGTAGYGKGSEDNSSLHEPKMPENDINEESRAAAMRLTDQKMASPLTAVDASSVAALPWSHDAARENRTKESAESPHPVAADQNNTAEPQAVPGNVRTDSGTDERTDNAWSQFESEVLAPSSVQTAITEVNSANSTLRFEHAGSEASRKGEYAPMHPDDETLDVLRTHDPRSPSHPEMLANQSGHSEQNTGQVPPDAVQTPSLDPDAWKVGEQNPSDMRQESDSVPLLHPSNASFHDNASYTSPGTKTQDEQRVTSSDAVPMVQSSSGYWTEKLEETNHSVEPLKPASMRKEEDSKEIPVPKPLNTSGEVFSPNAPPAHDAAQGLYDAVSNGQQGVNFKAEPRMDSGEGFSQPPGDKDNSRQFPGRGHHGLPDSHCPINPNGPKLANSSEMNNQRKLEPDLADTNATISQEAGLAYPQSEPWSTTLDPPFGYHADATTENEISSSARVDHEPLPIQGEAWPSDRMPIGDEDGSDFFNVVEQQNAERNLDASSYPRSSIPDSHEQAQISGSAQQERHQDYTDTFDGASYAPRDVSDPHDGRPEAEKDGVIDLGFDSRNGAHENQRKESTHFSAIVASSDGNNYDPFAVSNEEKPTREAKVAVDAFDWSFAGQESQELLSSSSNQHPSRTEANAPKARLQTTEQIPHTMTTGLSDLDADASLFSAHTQNVSDGGWQSNWGSLTHQKGDVMRPGTNPTDHRANREVESGLTEYEPQTFEPQQSINGPGIEDPNHGYTPGAVSGGSLETPQTLERNQGYGFTPPSQEPFAPSASHQAPDAPGTTHEQASYNVSGGYPSDNPLPSRNSTWEQAQNHTQRRPLSRVNDGALAQAPAHSQRHPCSQRQDPGMPATIPLPRPVVSTGTERAPEPIPSDEASQHEASVRVNHIEPPGSVSQHSMGNWTNSTTQNSEVAAPLQRSLPQSSMNISSPATHAITQERNLMSGRREPFSGEYHASQVDANSLAMPFFSDKPKSQALQEDSNEAGHSDFSMQDNDIGTPIQEPPLVPEVIPSHICDLRTEDGRRRESSVDPATYAYPYSIMDCDISEDFRRRPPRPILTWGFGGKILTVIPKMKPKDEQVPSEFSSIRVTSSSKVNIYEARNFDQDKLGEDWAAACQAVAPLNFPVRPSDLASYGQMCERLAQITAKSSSRSSEGSASLWRLLALMCRRGTSDWRRDAASAIAESDSPATIDNARSAVLPESQLHSDSPLNQREHPSPMFSDHESSVTSEVERLLSAGKSVEATRAAKDGRLWSIALMLAVSTNRDLYQEVVSEFAASNTKDGSVLQTLCLSAAENYSEVLRKATSESGLNEWKRTVASLLTARQLAMDNSQQDGSKFLSLIDQVGEALVQRRNDLAASQLCFLLSGRLSSLDDANPLLLGATKKLSSSEPRSAASPASVLQSMVFEACSNSQSGTKFLHLLPLRLILAEEISVVGRTSVALQHCEAITACVREAMKSGDQEISPNFFTTPFLSQLESLEHRLRTQLGYQELSGKRESLLELRGSCFSTPLPSLAVEGDVLRSPPAYSSKLPAMPVSYQNSPASVHGSGPSYSEAEGIRKEVPRSFPPPPAAPIAPIPAAAPAVNPSMPFNNGRPSDEPYAAQSFWKPPQFAEPSTPASTAQNGVGMPTPWQVNSQTPEHSGTVPVEASPYGDRTNSTSQGADNTGKKRWNSIVSKTIGFIAPAEGDLSPLPQAMAGQGFPPNALPTPLGLGPGTGNRAPGYDAQAAHMRSASVGDFPTAMMQGHRGMGPSFGEVDSSRRPASTSLATAQNEHSNGGQAQLDGVPVQRPMSNNASDTAAHRRTASDITFASQTSEMRPPRQPKKPSAPSNAREQAAAPAARGWRSRLSEKIRAAFGGPPRAHMGLDNKFKFDNERGRWVIEGEDPDENEEEDAPPPDDDTLNGVSGTVPFNQSYESLPNPDLYTRGFDHSQNLNPRYDGSVNGGSQALDNSRRYSYNAPLPYNSSTENVFSRDTGSESSAASASSAPAPQALQAGYPPRHPGNKYRAASGARAGRRAYVDTFNKEGTSASVPSLARPGMPGLGGAGQAGGNGFRIFTPAPAPFSASGASSAGGSEGNANVAVAQASQSTNDERLSRNSVRSAQGESESLSYGRASSSPALSGGQLDSDGQGRRRPRLMA